MLILGSKSIFRNLVMGISKDIKSLVKVLSDEFNAEQYKLIQNKPRKINKHVKVSLMRFSACYLECLYKYQTLRV